MVSTAGEIKDSSSDGSSFSNTFESACKKEKGYGLGSRNSDGIYGISKTEDALFFLNKRKLSDAKRSSQQGRDSLEVLQSKIKNHRARLAESQIERERERLARKRLQEDLEALRRKASQLKAQLEGSSTVGKLRHELQEYKEILKCISAMIGLKSVWSRQYSRIGQFVVMITKCYHLFCSPCVQRLTETRHRRCPVCSTSFGPNDVKPVYI